MTNNKISDAEAEVMQVLWKSKKAITAIEIFEELNKTKSWKNSTVRTLVRRLTEKGFLKKERQIGVKQNGKELFYYSPLISHERYRLEKTRDFVKTTFNGNVKKLVASLFDNNLLTDEDVGELNSFWNKERDKLNE
ncbi:BlaI/MecI/CopY family transcriptional regulator [Clostridiaceae bacterium M8S5]|nr:BlaI/MecI/CopY family transcriptional regulator [Clostridiaceae bacterium M8S5]